MKKHLPKVLGLLLAITFMLSSCEMAQTRSDWNGLADGAKLPAEFAIASGEPIIILQCLGGLRDQFNEGGLSDIERGEIALDMIDLIAVLSNAVHNLAPFLLGEEDPAILSEIDDFFDSADIAILNLIAQEQLMESGIYADPAPMQLFWSILSLASYTGLDYSAMTLAEQAFYNQIVAEAENQANEGSNTTFAPLLSEFRSHMNE